jgi:dimethylhistidine N-methyltransferase
MSMQTGQEVSGDEVERSGGHLGRIAHDVRRGLTSEKKSLPAWLFYDDTGSRLYEAITRLHEYYPTRTERAILSKSASEAVEAAAAGAREVFALELGAGTGEKTQILVRAIARRQRRAVYFACDVSPAPLAELAARFAREEPDVLVTPVVGHHDRALEELRALPEQQLAIFLGSSIGNYDGDEAVELLSDVSDAMQPGGALLLGTDLRKDPRVLLRAYDDDDGVTATFNLNVLARINRELGGDFALSCFRHVALWNEEASRIEMHLESTVDQTVRIRALRTVVRFARGERIHTESSVKYDLPMVDAMLGASGFAREATFTDARGWFAVHVARAQHRRPLQSLAGAR